MAEEGQHKVFDPFAQFLHFIPWISLDGVAKVVEGEGDADVSSAVLDLYTGDVQYNYTSARTQQTGPMMLTPTLQTTIEFIITWLASVENVLVWAQLTHAVSYPPDPVTRHIGWKILGSRLYVSNADDSAQTITDTGIDLEAVDQFTRLKLVFTPGVDIKFYVNGELVATHTTHLPTDSLEKTYMFIQTLENDYKEVAFDRILLQQAYA
jgi:hypothetical protein